MQPTQPTITKEQLTGAIEIIRAVADAIKELGSVPSGHLYANLMRYLSYSKYMNIIEILKNAKLIEENDFHLLTWIGK